nr:MerR family transcriptional regulator [Maliibacterium massiliense]
MKQHAIRLTTAQFAKLLDVNKRTLHYYDDIGLFSPRIRGENGYRYYDVAQSMDFAYIRMLKELGLRIAEIAAYVQHPSPALFNSIASRKEKELDAQIRHLQRTRKTLRRIKEQVAFCETLRCPNISIVACKAELLLLLPYDFAQPDIADLYAYARGAWSLEQIRMGIGGYISLDKVQQNDFERYDGIYTPALARGGPAKSMVKPGGAYLCGYQQGAWDQLPRMYRQMLAYARENGLKLTGYAFEMGLNEFVIARPEDYITRIMIKIA